MDAMGYRGNVFNLGWGVVQVQINKGFLEVTLKLNPKG